MSTQTTTFLPRPLVHLIGITTIAILLFITAGMTAFQPMAWKVAWLALAGAMGSLGWWEVTRRNSSANKEDKTYLVTVAIILAITLGVSLLPGHDNTPSMTEMIQLGWAKTASR